MAELLTINDFMQRYSVSRTLVYRLVANGLTALDLSDRV